MDAKFRSVLSSLYQEFGDEGIHWIEAEMAARFSAPGASDAPVAASHTASSEKKPTSKKPTPNKRGHVGESDSSARHEGNGYEDEQAFSAHMENHVNHLGVTAISSPDEVVDAVRDLVLMAGEVRKFEEAQVTKRMGIAAERDVAIANIKAQKDVLQDYLNRSFDERAENFERLFDVVDGALDTNNMTALAMGLESVVKLAASSPFKDLRTVEETAAALTDPDHEWDF